MADGKQRRRWRVAATFVIAAGIGPMSACDAPILPATVSPFERVTLHANVDPVGTAHLDGRYVLSDSRDATVTIAAATDGTVREITAGGDPVHVTGDRTGVAVDGPRARVAAELAGVVTRTPTHATLTLPLWTSDGSAERSDPLIALDVLIRMPRGALASAASARNGAAWLGVYAPRVTITGDSVRLTGSIHPARDATAVIPLSGAAFGAVPVADAVQVGSQRAERVLASQHRRDAAYFAAASRDRRFRQLAAIGYWLLLALEVLVPLGVVAVRAARGSARRRRAAATAPATVSDPPSTPAADLAALLATGGNRIEAASVAASLIGLIDTKIVELDHVTSTMFRVRPVADGPVEGAAGQRPGTAADGALVAELTRLAQDAGSDGWIDAPLPLVRGGAWWQMYRRDIVHRARDARLIRRRFPAKLYIASVVALVITSAPLWGRSPGLAAGAFVAALVLLALSALGGFELTDEGLETRAQWRAFERHAADDPSLREASVPAVTIWGHHLVAAAALGIPKPAIAASSRAADSRRRTGDVPATVAVLTLCATFTFAALVAPAPWAAATSGPSAASVQTATPPEPTCPVGSRSDQRKDVIDAEAENSPLSGRDLSCQDLHGLRLIHVDLSGADLRHANLRDVDFGQATLTGALLTGADLRGADLTQVTLERADLSRADLRSAVFGQARARGAVFNRARARNAKFGQAVLDLADLRGIDATAADFAQTSLRRVDASKGLFTRADFTQADVTESDFGAARLTDADLGVTTAVGAMFDGADLTGAEWVDQLRRNGGDLDGALGLPQSHFWQWFAAVGVVLLVAVVLAVLVLRSRALSRTTG